MSGTVKPLIALFRRAPDGRLHWSPGASATGMRYPLMRGWKWVAFREVKARASRPGEAARAEPSGPGDAGK